MEHVVYTSNHCEWWVVGLTAIGDWPKPCRQLFSAVFRRAVFQEARSRAVFRRAVFRRSWTYKVSSVPNETFFPLIMKRMKLESVDQ